MDLLDAIRWHLLALPDLAKFAVIVAVIVGVPRIAARIRLPAMVGLLLFGVALGPHVLGFFGEHRPIADFFAELGKLLLMFAAGLEFFFWGGGLVVLPIVLIYTAAVFWISRGKVGKVAPRYG